MLFVKKRIGNGAFVAIVAIVAVCLLACGSAAGAQVTWNNASGNSAWDTTSANWDVGTYTDGDAVTFGGTAPGTVNVDAGLTPGSVTVSNGNYTLQGAGWGGSGGLTKSGSGTLKLTAPNTYAGPTLVNSGSLQLQIGPAAALSARMLAHFNLNEGSGTTVGNTAFEGSLTNGTLNTAGTQASWTPDGKFGNAVQVVGENGAGAMTTGTTFGITGSTPRTISAWVKTSSTQAELLAHGTGDGDGSRRDLFGIHAGGWKNGGGGQWFNFGFSNSSAANAMPDNTAGWLVLNNSAGWAWSTSGGATLRRNLQVMPWNAFADGEWQLLTGTYDASDGLSGTAKAYLNGIEVASGLWEQSGASSTGFGFANYLTGIDFTIDDLRLYNRVLSADEVANLYSYAGGPSEAAANFLPAVTAMTVDASATLDLGGVYQEVASLEGSGVITNNHASVSTTLKVNGSSTSVFSGTLSDGASPLGLEMAGSGKQTLTGANNHTGATNITAGTLQIGDGTNDTASAGAGSVTVYAGGKLSLNFNGDVTLPSAAVYTLGSGIVENIGAGKVTINNQGIGNGSTYDGGAGGLVLPNPITDSVGVYIKGDVWSHMNMRWSSYLAAGPAATLHLNNNISSSWVTAGPEEYPLNIDLGPYSLSWDSWQGGINYVGDLEGAGTFNVHGGNRNNQPYGTTYIVGASSMTGTLNLNEGGRLNPVFFGNGGAGGFAGDTNIVNNLAGSNADRVNADPRATQTVSGVYFNSTTDNEYSGNMSGSGRVFKQGPNTLTMSGTNSYTGATNVNAGTLLVNGTHTGGGTYTVASGAAFGGNGSIDSALMLNGADFWWDGSSTLTVVDGNVVSLDNSFGIESLVGFDWATIASDTYTLIANDSDFSNIQNWGLANAYTLDDDRLAYFHEGSLQLTVLSVVPEPGTWLLMLSAVACGLCGLLVRRRRGC